jgi:bacteriocin-like protein
MSESMKSRKNNELSDAELNQVQGGLGVYSGYMCKKCPDSSTFKRYFTTRPNNGCPNYQSRYGERGDLKSCGNCKHVQYASLS